MAEQTLPVPGMGRNLAPAVGTIFLYQGARYRVNSWLKAKTAITERPWWERNRARDLIDEVLYTTEQQVGPDRCRVAFCSQEEAEYVSGRGVSGCIARIDDIEVVGMVAWPLEQLVEAHEQAMRYASGDGLYPELS